MRQKILLLVLLIILSLPSVFALFHKGFFQSDDGEWMVIRFSAFHQALRDGQFPVRFLPRLNFDYGYPVANFLYPGFMYLAEPIHLVGFGFVDSIKIIFGISMIGSLIFCYLWLSKFFNKIPSIVGSLFYLYAPYHLFDIYTRGSVGEIVALAIIPFILWQIERRNVLWSSFGVGFLILSHNSLALLFLPIIISYMLIKKSSLLPMIFGLGLSAFFWIPALYDLQYTIFSYTKVSEPFEYFAPLNLVGYLLMLIFLVGIAILILQQKIIRKQSMFYVLLFFLIIGILSIILSSSVSQLLWTIIPISFIQFPFRLLSIEILSVAFITAFLLNLISKKEQLLPAGILFVFLLISSYQYLMPKVFFDKEEGFYATNEATTTVKNEYMPKWINVFPNQHPVRKVEITSGQIEDLEIKSNKITFRTISEKDTTLKVNNVFFPGWIAYIDDREIPISYSNIGVIEIEVPSGDHKAKVIFTETRVRLLSDVVSLTSFVILMSLTLNIRILKKHTL